MRKFNIILILAAFFVACNNGLPDEMFEKKVIINQNGFLDYELDYTSSETSDTIISVAVSGTSKLKKDVIVNMQIDKDTLDNYNWERFRNQEILYYDLLPENCYEFNGKNVVIKSGTEYTDIPITFHLEKIDKNKQFVLPISIANSSDYKIGESKYSTVLMRIKLTNQYSGTYNLSATLKESGSDETLEVRMNRELSVMDDNTCYLYAGNIAENRIDRELYKINITVKADSSITFSALNPDMILNADQPVLDLENPKNRVSRIITQDVTNKQKQLIITTFFVNYSYTDLTTPDYPIDVRVDGMLTRTKIKYVKPTNENK